MPVSGEPKTVQSRILEYAPEIGWTYVPRDDGRAAVRFRLGRRDGGGPGGETRDARSVKS